MTERRSDDATTRRSRLGAGRARPFTPALALVMIFGCAGPTRNEEAIDAYYRSDFASARVALRDDVASRDDENVLLDDVRLGMAALADGDTTEAERALLDAFDLLSTAGLNNDRATAAVVLHEGVRIWKGEPFEQALAYHYVATLYAVKGDWENARAAAANALFRLTDFGRDQAGRGYTAADTDFVLGFLMQGVAARLAGADGTSALDTAETMRPDLEPLVKTLHEGDFDTLLIVDYGRGPTKVAHGPDASLVSFRPQHGDRGPLVVSIDGRRSTRFAAACDVNTMARDHQWNHLESVRQVKSGLGNALVVAGIAVAANEHQRHHGPRYDGPWHRGVRRRERHHDRYDDGWTRQLVGGGMTLAGLLLKSGARADTRYVEFTPQAIYLAPLRLGRAGALRVQVRDDPDSALRLPHVVPGTPSSPRVIYLRLHDGYGRPATL